ncbi:MAG: hypothetical protein SGI77_08990 [Pirellulaceae bacterium]|nr:hypothetical protein [Pirellulaceae bacterium]
MIQKTFSFSEPPMQPAVAVLREVGDARKLRGMMLAADRRAELVAASQVALLQALLASADSTATVDDATADLTEKFADGGRWRGSIPSRLARLRIIERVGDCKSDRPSRHRAYVSRWLLRDREQAQHEIDRLSRWLDATKNPLSAATDAGNSEPTNTNSINSNGVNEHASK